MRIVTHSVHTGFEYDWAKTGHDFFAVHPYFRIPWRPMSPNWTLVEGANESYDIAVISMKRGWDVLQHLKIPFIYSAISDFEEALPEGIDEDRIKAFVYLGPEVAGRWKLKDPSKKRVIPMGIDAQVFQGYVGDREGAFTAGRDIPNRPVDKGPEVMAYVDARTKTAVAGRGNDSLRGNLGFLDFADFVECYKRYQVYFNPSPYFGITLAEAMVTGMPVVTMRTRNLCDLITHGENGYVVDTADQAIMTIDMLKTAPDLRQRIGAKGRETAMAFFDLSRFITQWNTVFAEVKAMA